MLRLLCLLRLRRLLLRLLRLLLRLGAFSVEPATLF
jgi:hypothetical protein